MIWVWIAIGVYAGDCPTHLRSSLAIKFNVVPAASVTTRQFDLARREYGPTFEARVDEPFEMAQTPVTRAQWSFLYPDVLTARPQFPVVGRSRARVLKLVHQINAWSKANDPRLIELIPDHRPNSRYRLPREEEWVVAATLAWRDFQARSRAPRLMRVAWLRQNSGGGLRAVATRAPTRINGQPFWDLFGLVEELVDDYWREDMRTPLNAVPVEEPEWATTRGGSVLNLDGLVDILALRTGHRPRFSTSPSAREKVVGFRLVREIDRRGPKIRDQ